MLIVGALSSIAIPVFVTQRAKARDSATQSDVVNVGQEIATYHVDGRGSLSLDLTVRPGRAVLTDGSWETTVNLTKGTAAPSLGESRDLDDAVGWCISLTDPRGAVESFRYSAASGLEEGTC
jgi:type II secretory pathway pseudopilin PulG